MQLDSLMGGLFRMMRKRESRGDTSLLRSQREWISEREKKCPISVEQAESLDRSRAAARCISEMTMARMDKLLEINGAPRRDLSPLFELMKRPG
jgi:uncharacterized protein YecT (DUF1311 family)